MGDFMGAAFATHASVLTDGAIDILTKVSIPAVPHVRKVVAPSIPEAPCDGCPMVNRCKVTGECCRAFKCYVKDGKYLDKDVGTI